LFLTPNEQVFSYIIAITRYILIIYLKCIILPQGVDGIQLYKNIYIYKADKGQSLIKYKLKE